MAVTKYESYYKQIKESVDEIKENYDYKNSSNAFIHWYLKNHSFDDFYKDEIPLREMCSSPPLKKIILIYFNGKDQGTGQWLR